MNREPVITAGTIASLVSAVVGLVVAFGLHLSKDQITAVTVLVGVVAPFVAAWFARARVTPVQRPVRGEGGAVDLVTVLVAVVIVILIFVLLGAIR